jgi:DNA-binding Lrp family transcriptional regulator
MVVDSRLDVMDRELLNLVQSAFPLTREPYTDLGAQLGITADEVIGRMEKFRQDGMIRQISPVLDGPKLGYKTTLVAMRITHDLEKAERVIKEHPGVSHGYEREHRFNVWFTLATAPCVDADAEVLRIGSSFAPAAAFALPATKLYKLEVYFDMTGDGKPAKKAHFAAGGTSDLTLSAADRAVINVIQQSLPLEPRPFDGMAEKAGLPMDVFLSTAQSLLERRVMRRYGASLNHHEAGFKANAMTCWVIASDEVDAVGKRLAALREVSHCYERRTNPLWSHNLFAMIHGHSIEECQSTATTVSAEFGLGEPLMLYSTKEFKKARIRYTV